MGNAEGFKWKIPRVFEHGNFKAEHEVAGTPGNLLIEGPISEDGAAKLSAYGIEASRKYARGLFARKGEAYSYDIKAEFKETTEAESRHRHWVLWGVPACLAL